MDENKVRRQTEKQMSNEISNTQETVSLEESKSEIQKPTLVKKQVLVDKPSPSPRGNVKVQTSISRHAKPPNNNPQSPFSPKSNRSQQLGNILITENVPEAPKVKILENTKVLQCLLNFLQVRDKKTLYRCNRALSRAIQPPKPVLVQKNLDQ